MVGLSISPVYLMFIFYVAWAVGHLTSSETKPTESDLCVGIKDSHGKVFNCATIGPTSEEKNHIGGRIQSKQEQNIYYFLMKPTRTQRIWNDQGNKFKRYRRSMKGDENLSLDMGLWALSSGNETNNIEPIRNRWRSWRNIEQQHRESSGEDEEWGRLESKTQRKQKKTTYDLRMKPTRTKIIWNAEGTGNRKRRSMKEEEENLRRDMGLDDPVLASRRTKRACRAL
ncbi:uncharacterized protein LOC133532496 isoform X2 [Cydia pomonella]|uniref:uncharacterized protein LOC133532496 isoform X2 n=1 Tax=Cydia pomonella TaxID=82600 RepID=UPI002ADE02C2|nr:uncharacterized protein LOC133532496 isoform X2 [Cydia pomonella]